MNRKTSRLALHRETLRILSGESLRKAAGGVSEMRSQCANSKCTCSDPCPSDVCTQYPACQPTGVNSCDCSIPPSACLTTLTD